MGSLDIVHLKKSYGSVQVLNDINLSIEKGGFLVLVGPSGCGKSTLLNTIAGLEPISGGEIRIAGRDVSGLRPADRDIAMVFQSYALYPTMTVAQNIAFGLEMRKVPKPERDAAVKRVAETLQITHLLDRKPSQLSGGQRQRVAMGRALTRNPQVFLFDEPLSNLDAKLRVDMRTEIKRLHERLKTTIVYVTHDQIEAMTLATKIAVLKGGVLQQFGTPAEIYERPANLFVAEFMGSPSMNLVRAGVDPDGGAVTLARGGEPLRLPVKAGRILEGYGGREIIVGIRPEAITEPRSENGADPSVVVSDFRIDVVEPTGADVYAISELGGRQAIGRCSAGYPIRAGQTARLAIHTDKIVYFDPKTEERIG
ncbi:ABC transporter ATP-binding protein [Antarcticirhabdus aurantiaca]|uniref:ABC transporter ATP-binding protein n=1 Tax=Antarcticirhabdus aurantiaca TaxID=2606717 RepID=A0ACD4NH69_9HYPH|nr:ABC transporter ATP-binding protein [Antarcticirhabdus aurantiaca]WAJ26135.1 ABC transporter ATP-binding protein [Jeongeuplla avenae]